jgi:hypothetical protein
MGNKSIIEKEKTLKFNVTSGLNSIVVKDNSFCEKTDLQNDVSWGIIFATSKSLGNAKMIPLHLKEFIQNKHFLGNLLY